MEPLAVKCPDAGCFFHVGHICPDRRCPCALAVGPDLRQHAAMHPAMRMTAANIDRAVLAAQVARRTN